MASGDTQAIDIIEVESAITSKTTDISSSGKDVELDEYGIKCVPFHFYSFHPKFIAKTRMPSFFPTLKLYPKKQDKCNEYEEKMQKIPT